MGSSRRMAVLGRPRSGTTVVMEMLGSHPQVHNMQELLNASNHVLPTDRSGLLDLLNYRLSTPAETVPWVAFKVLTYQLEQLGLPVDELVRKCDVDKVVVVWREEVVQSVVSLNIALETQEWYLSKKEKSPEPKTRKATISEELLRSQIRRDEDLWTELFQQWPAEVTPVFVQYETLFGYDDKLHSEEETAHRFRDVYVSLGLQEPHKCEFYGARQNPAPLSEKILNWDQLPANLRTFRRNVPKLFFETMHRRLGLPKSVSSLDLPHPEPQLSSVRYRVAEPYIPAESVAYVNEALAAGSVSSAGEWPRKLADKLKQIFGVPVAMPCNNGFSSLVLALQSANVGKDDHVIVPSFTMVAVSNAVLFVGAQPIFVDSASAADDYNPAWRQFEAAATERTKAVILSHTYGCPARSIIDIADGCADRKWTLIEDISECVGVRFDCAIGNGQGQLLGTFGDYACASMYANKIVHACDGGFLLAKDPSAATRLESLANHGFTKRFHFVHFEQAINAKINGLGAAVACGVLERLPEIMAHRTRLSAWYRRRLAPIFATGQLQPMPTCGLNDTPWVFGVHCQSKVQRSQLRCYLAKYGVETRDYFYPLHRQPMFDGQHESLSLPNAQRLGSTGFYLPTHSNLNEQAVNEITGHVLAFFNIQTRDESGHQPRDDATAFALLTSCSECFMGTESWDDRHELAEQITRYLRTKCESELALHKELRAFGDYFRASLANNTHENIEENQTGGSVRDYVARLLSRWTEDPHEDHFEQRKIIIFTDSNANSSPWLTSLQSNFATTSVSLDKLASMDLQSYSPFPKDECNVGYVGVLDLSVFSNDALEGRYDVLVEALKNLNIRRLLLVRDEWAPVVPFLRLLADVCPSYRLLERYKTARYFTRSIDHVAELAQENWDQLQTVWNRPFARRLRFVDGPRWTHLHLNAFEAAVDGLRKSLHSEDATLLFIPALEQFICDAERTPQQPWVGIVHSSIKNADQFYVPDLERLVSRKRYTAWLKHCVGLFTLTTAQRDYLKSHLHPKYSFTIQQIFYPAVPLPMNAADEVTTRTDQVYFIGSFDRDFDHFFNATFPIGYRKVLLLADEDELASLRVPSDVQVIKERLDDDEYEEVLRRNLVFLSLKEGGAANTLLIECIMRNVPIVVPRLQSVVDYIGAGYPLLYPKDTTDFTQLMSEEHTLNAAKYLAEMDKAFLTREYFVQSVRDCSVLASANSDLTSSKLDVTVLVCCYRRTQYLQQILENLAKKQSYAGAYQILVWNNNASRTRHVTEVVEKVRKSLNNNRVALTLINSDENHYCGVRFAMPQLMRGERLLICDDDIVPDSDFVGFFLRASETHAEDVLCVRGYEFLPHTAPTSNAHQIWTDYEHVRFHDDHAPACLLHYVHADACLIPKKALREVASIEPPDESFMLVDDYWMSYVLSAVHGRQLRKLCMPDGVLSRLEGSDEPGIALHMRRDVAEARTRMYLYHIAKGWPNFSSLECVTSEDLALAKKQSWSRQRTGFNINSEIGPTEIDLLDQMGVRLVRIGAVGVGRDYGYEFAELNERDAGKALADLETLVGRLQQRSIDVVLTLDDRVATEDVWSTLAGRLARYSNVVGYDLINEPVLPADYDYNWLDVGSRKLDAGVLDTLTAKFAALIKAVRAVDRVTPIIVEPPFWANINALHELDISALKEADPCSNLMVSVHFYTPQTLTYRETGGKTPFKFPGTVKVTASEDDRRTIMWTEDAIVKAFAQAKRWADAHDVDVFVGEFGCSRDVVGADKYLQSVVDACHEQGFSSCIYAFRDPDWEAMDYELGTDAGNYKKRTTDSTENKLFSVINGAFSRE